MCFDEKTDCLMLYRGTLAVYCKNSVNYVTHVGRMHVCLIDGKPGGACSGLGGLIFVKGLVISAFLLP